ncbi:MAG: BrnT family toxin [Lachnospiraceae bacterium]|nr:BrnT family toxin [Lachnospiraceae bacterium]
MIIEFEWDERKEKINIVKHGIDFDTAALVFGDKDRIEKYDEVHSLDKERYITIGLVNGTAILVTVVYVERMSAIRIISARLANRKELEEYYDNKKEY